LIEKGQTCHTRQAESIREISLKHVRGKIELPCLPKPWFEKALNTQRGPGAGTGAEADSYLSLAFALDTREEDAL